MLKRPVNAAARLGPCETNRQNGWAVLLLRVLAATLLLSAFLLWADGLAWVDVHSKLTRLLQFAGVMLGAVLIYFGALALSGFKLRQLVRR